MLLATRNMAIGDNNRLIDKGYELLESRLPEGWNAELSKQVEGGEAYIWITAPDHKRISIVVEAKTKLDPRQALEFARSSRAGEPRLIIASYLSPATRERLAEAGVSFLDLTGNARVVLSRPGLFIDTGGVDVDPNSVPRPSRSLRGSKAGRVVRALIDTRSPGGVRDIAAQAGVDPGYVSRVLSLLDREAVIERGGRGKITSVDWLRLLRRWAEDAPLESRGAQVTCLDPRGVSALLDRISDADSNGQPGYAVTGSFVASKFAPVSAPRLITIYVRRTDHVIKDLGLRRVDAGANVLLIEPEDDGVFSGTRQDGTVRCVALSQASADLLGSPGRGPADGEALLEWMKEHEEVWRG